MKDEARIVSTAMSHKWVWMEMHDQQTRHEQETEKEI
jgi:hypothetical protein